MKSTAVVVVVATGGVLSGASALAPAAASAPVAPSPLTPAFAAFSAPTAAASAPSSPSASAAAPTPAAPAPTTPAPPPRPVPVAGLDQAAMDNAATIVRVGQQRGIPQRGLVVAVATAMQESDLHNVASNAVPESLHYAHQGVEQDADSVGLFQQRPSQGWGSVGQLMDPAHSADLFFGALERVPGWESMSVTAAAQAVQRSAYPGAYQKHESAAQAVVHAIL